jgi:uncharacterized membrane protein
VKIGARVDLLMYARAVPMLLRRPSILAMPLLAGVIASALDQISLLLTDAVGGAGAGIFGSIAQIVYLYAFGIAVIQASHAWRGRKATFDEAWEEGRHKAGGILMAAIGFLFVTYVANYAGSIVNATIGLLLQLVASFFLIYSMPAAAIGGLPGQMALSGSMRAVRENVFGAAILAIVFVVLWAVLPLYVLSLPLGGNRTAIDLVLAAVRALVLAYLAFPFAKQYDDVAFRGFW